MTGKPTLIDRTVQVFIILVALICLANGAMMVWNPFGWYQMVPTVKFTGPPNPHFIRDIGLAYLWSAAMLGFAAVNPPMRWLTLLAGSIWISLHGGFHIWELFTGICAPDRFWKDAPGTLGPPLLAWIALGLMLVRQRIAPMGIPKAAYLAAVDRLAPGESEYLHEIAAAPGHALEKFKHFMPATMHRHEAPADLFHMARIGATLVEDCGPCALTAAQGALQDGVDRDTVNAALAANPPDGDLQTAFVFGAAIAQQSADALALGDLIERDYGRTVRIELAMTAATVRAYPAMKRGLGLTQSCSVTALEV
jgi:hypothetical protein